MYFLRYYNPQTPFTRCCIPFRSGLHSRSDTKFSPVHTMPDSHSFSVHTTTLRSAPPTGPQQCLFLKKNCHLTEKHRVLLRVAPKIFAPHRKRGPGAQTISDSCLHTSPKAIRHEKRCETFHLQSGVI